jgi:small subunit ribosomal protein S2
VRQPRLEAIRKTVERGESVLFLGTKKQAKTVVEEEARRCGQFYVTERWLGGMLTNFQTIRKSLGRMKELQKLNAEGGADQLNKKERIRVARSSPSSRRCSSASPISTGRPDCST